MKTNSLIEILAHDPPRGPKPGFSIFAILGALLTGCGFFVFLGLRPDIGTPSASMAVAAKLGVTLPLAVFGLIAAKRLAEPGRDCRHWLLALAIAPLILLASCVGDYVLRGPDGLAQRAMGAHGLRCLLITLLLSIAPLATIGFAQWRGAVTRPVASGAMAGLAAAGIGASFYALNCTDDSPFFVLLWYSLAITVVVCLGTAGSRRLPRW